MYESVYATLQRNHKKSNFFQRKKLHINMFILLKITYQMFMDYKIIHNHKSPKP